MASKTAATSRLLKLLAHPVRTEILRVLPPGTVKSPSRLSEELGIPLNTVNYHVRVMADLDAVELVGTKPKRGAVEHFYRATVRPLFDNANWLHLTDEERAGVTRAIALAMVQDIAEGLETGAVDSRLDRHMTRSPLQLDEPAWAELEPRVNELLALGHELQEQAANRIAAGETTAIDARLMLVLYGIPTGGPHKSTVS